MQLLRAIPTYLWVSRAMIWAVCDWSWSKSSQGLWQTIPFSPRSDPAACASYVQLYFPRESVTLLPPQWNTLPFSTGAAGHKEKSSNCLRGTQPSCDLARRCLIFFLFSLSPSSWAAGKEWLLLNDKIMNVIFEAGVRGRKEGERVGHKRGERGSSKRGVAGEESILQRWQMCPHARESIWVKPCNVIPFTQKSLICQH